MSKVAVSITSKYKIIVDEKSEQIIYKLVSIVLEFGQQFFANRLMEQLSLVLIIL